MNQNPPLIKYPYFTHADVGHMGIYPDAKQLKNILEKPYQLGRAALNRPEYQGGQLV